MMFTADFWLDYAYVMATRHQRAASHIVWLWEQEVSRS